MQQHEHSNNKAFTRYASTYLWTLRTWSRAWEHFDSLVVNNFHLQPSRYSCDKKLRESFLEIFQANHQHKRNESSSLECKWNMNFCFYHRTSLVARHHEPSLSCTQPCHLPCGTKEHAKQYDSEPSPYFNSAGVECVNAKQFIFESLAARVVIAWRSKAVLTTQNHQKENSKHKTQILSVNYCCVGMRRETSVRDKMLKCVLLRLLMIDIESIKMFETKSTWKRFELNFRSLFISKKQRTM